MAKKNTGLLILDSYIHDEDRTAAINAGLLRGGLAMMMPTRGGRGKFAPQFAQGAMHGLDVYDSTLNNARTQRAAQEQARKKEAALQGLLGIYDSPEEQADAVAPMRSMQFNGQDLPQLDMRPKSNPQNYGEFNPRGRVPNASDMENDEHESMALQGMEPEEREEFLMSRDEDRNFAGMPKPAGQIPPIVQSTPYPDAPFKENGVYQLPIETVVERRFKQTEPIPYMPQFDLRDSQQPTGINPGTAPVRVGNNNGDWGARYRAIQTAMANGVPGAKEALEALLEERKPKMTSISAGQTLFDERSGKVAYQSPEAAYSLSPGETRMRGDQRIASAPERAPTPTQLSKLMQERDQLERVNPNHPQLQIYNRVIANYKQGGGVTVNTGQPKAPVGFRYRDDGETLEAIAGGPQDELDAAQKKQLLGAQNTRDAIREYRDIIPSLTNFDFVRPDRQAQIGMKYNNMLLQAKEAYNLGVINGPDYEILQRVMTNPISLKGSITSREALDYQASELDKILAKIEQNVGNRRPQDVIQSNQPGVVNSPAPLKNGLPAVPSDLPQGTRLRGHTPDGRPLWQIPGQDKPIVGR